MDQLRIAMADLDGRGKWSVCQTFGQIVISLMNNSLGAPENLDSSDRPSPAPPPTFFSVEIPCSVPVSHTLTIKALLTCKHNDHHVPASRDGDRETHQGVSKHLPPTKLAQVRQGLVNVHSSTNHDVSSSSFSMPQKIHFHQYPGVTCIPVDDMALL